VHGPLSFRYQRFYCEENVWWLAQEPCFGARSRWVLFIKGERGHCAFWYQNANEAGPTVWDYHVVLVVGGAHGFEVWDQDSVMTLPTALEQYLECTFPQLPERLAEFRPRFRLVEAEEHLSRFCSDRGHMRAEDGGWIHPPPTWSPPQPPPRERIDSVSMVSERPPSNLGRFLDLDDDIAGQVMDMEALLTHFAALS